ncbi:MAG: SAM-dependent methyltransferase [Anaerotignum sp.]
MTFITEEGRREYGRREYGRRLYLCATPIGNPDDMTLRALKWLEMADIIAAEDTRKTLKLLNHFEIKTPMTSYHEHNKAEKGPKSVERLLAG